MELRSYSPKVTQVRTIIFNLIFIINELSCYMPITKNQLI